MDNAFLNTSGFATTSCTILLVFRRGLSAFSSPWSAKSLQASYSYKRKIQVCIFSYMPGQMSRFIINQSKFRLQWRIVQSFGLRRY